MEQVLYVKNPYKSTWILRWDGQVYKLKANEITMLPVNVVKAYFPDKDELEAWLPKDEPRRTKELRGLLEIYISRWDKIPVTFSSDIAKQNEEILRFFESFVISPDKDAIVEYESKKNDK